MRVAGLWRYPVKSMQGEAEDAVSLVPSGVEGDRRFGVYDVTSETVVSAKRDGRLLEARARTVAGSVAVTVPGAPELGPGAELDERLSGWLGRSVRLVDSADLPVASFEIPSDFEADDSEITRWSGTSGSFVDSSPVHLIAISDLVAVAAERSDLQWDVRRFRPNVLLDDVDGPELATLMRSQRVVIGEVELEVLEPCSRCVMTTRAQPGGLERQLDVLRHVNASRGSNLGLLASVLGAGAIAVGDQVELLV